MPDTRIRTVVDHAAIAKGDVLIAKHVIPTPKYLMSICTKCGGLFRTGWRRMAPLKNRGARSCEVRSIPQCSPCRSSYRKMRRAA
jgi:hypothetical protein